MRQGSNPSRGGHGWGPFTSRQLTVIVCVAIVAAILIPTSAMAAVGAFTSTAATPAVSATNSATVANAKGVQGSATATNTNTRYGVTGNAGGVNGIGVQGTGTKYGVFSNGPLGVAAGKPLSCTGCVHAAALGTGRRAFWSDRSDRSHRSGRPLRDNRTHWHNRTHRDNRTERSFRSNRRLWGGQLRFRERAFDCTDGGAWIHRRSGERHGRDGQQGARQIRRRRSGARQARPASTCSSVTTTALR